MLLKDDSGSSSNSSSSNMPVVLSNKRQKQEGKERFLLYLFISESPLEISASFGEGNLLTVSLALMYSCRHTQRHCLFLIQTQASWQPTLTIRGTIHFLIEFKCSFTWRESIIDTASKGKDLWL